MAGLPSRLKPRVAAGAILATCRQHAAATLGAGVALLLVLHVLSPHRFRVDGYALALIGVLLVLALYPLLKSAKVTGVGSVEFRDELREGEAVAQRVEAKRAHEVEGRDRPSIADVHALFEVPDHLRDLADYDPNVALAGLRIELERAVRRAITVLYPEEQPRTLSAGIRMLLERGRLDGEQAELALAIIGLGNRAAHGELVTPDEAQEVFGWADTLNRSFGVGYALNFAPNLDFEEQGLTCEFEHCIENMPLRDRSEDSCPMYGHDCPGGRRRIATCPAAEAWLAEMNRHTDNKPGASSTSD